MANIFGQWWLRQWDRLLHKIPIVKSIYSSVKQVSDTLFSSSGNAFREAVLVQYPRAGSWTIAFVTGAPAARWRDHLGERYVSVYVPTTPEPDLGLLPDDAARRRGAAGDERRRGAEVHHLDGRGGSPAGGAACARRARN